MRVRNHMDHEHGQPIFEYSRITPWVWIGTNRCCTAHFSHALRRIGIRADVSLEAEQLDAAYGARYFLWLPVRDHHAPTHAQLRIGTQALANFAAERVRTYVHCRNGHGRAPTLVAAYLIVTERETVDGAVARIRQRRPSVHFEDVQVDALHRFANHLSTSSS